MKANCTLQVYFAETLIPDLYKKKSFVLILVVRAYLEGMIWVDVVDARSICDILKMRARLAQSPLRRMCL